jgi:hypothetical protein
LEHLTHDDRFWNPVIFSNEKVFQSSPNGRLKIYRPRGTCYVQGVQRSGRFSVNMWIWISAISAGVMVHVEERLTSDVYIRILENVMLPSVLATYPDGNYIFPHDNCSIHTAHRVAT